MKLISKWMTRGLAGALSLVCAAAWADILVVVGVHSPVNSLTKEQVADIYLGNSRVYPDGNKAIATIIGSGSTKNEFFTKVLDRSDSQVRAIWARQTFTGRGTTPRELKDSNEVKQAVAADPKVIGFIERSAVDSRVKIVYMPEGTALKQ
jgi:ABC-type phosphate transport system substrate-binding protein